MRRPPQTWLREDDSAAKLRKTAIHLSELKQAQGLGGRPPQWIQPTAESIQRRAMPPSSIL